MFLDEARIYVESGSGGDGIVHFRREKYIPRGGPDGGHGGRGGDVLLQADPGLNTLIKFRRKAHFVAQAGKPGGANNRTGRSGADLVIQVPCGTIVRPDGEQQVIGELLAVQDRLLVCRGGRGGRGNARFATARNQAPRMAEKGEPGEKRWLQLELRLIADVGIIGVPNAGKSTLLAAVTHARPKIGDYPFTTLQPNLGVAQLDEDATLVLADIPGIIEGAHAGTGLGIAFLRHVMRTAVLIHLIDGAAADPIADHSQVNSELAYFGQGLADKPQLVAVNKMDLPEVAERWPRLQARLEQKGVQPHAISALTRQGTKDLLWAAHAAVKSAQRVQRQSALDGEELTVYAPEPAQTEVTVIRESEHVWRLEGKAIERAAAMTYWEYDEAVRRFQRLLERLGVEQSLRQAGVQIGDTICIGEKELEWRE